MPPIDFLQAQLRVAREQAAECARHGYQLCAADYERQASELERLIEAVERKQA